MPGHHPHRLVPGLAPLRPALLLGVAAWLSCAAPGCVIVQPMVANPMANVTQVAIVPFKNESTEPAADVLLVTNAYYAELQKVPGFEVVPVSVTAKKIEDFGLKMRSPRDALELARILNVDAVVLGAITDFDPYDPPRIGLHVEWYSPHRPAFARAVPVVPRNRPNVWFGTRLCNGVDCVNPNCDVHAASGSWEAGGRRTAGRSRMRARDVVRGQSPDDTPLPAKPPIRIRGPRLIRPSDVRAAAATPPVEAEANEQPETEIPNASATDVRATDEVTPTALPNPIIVNVIKVVGIDDDDETAANVPRLDSPFYETTTEDPPAVPGTVAPNDSPSVPFPVPIDDEPLGDGPVRPIPPSDDLPIREPGVPDPAFVDSPAPNPVLPEPSHPVPNVDPLVPPYVPEHQPPVPYAPPAASPREPQRVPLLHPQPLPAYESAPPSFDPHEPIMAYTRIFDGRNADLQARLRDYYELNGDSRGGGWRAYLQRSEDFIRFTSHVMISEMLTLHGGLTKRRFVWKMRTRT